jgi:hypothetical protein
LEPVNYKEEDLEDEDEEQGPGDVKRAVLKPKGEPLQTEATMRSSSSTSAPTILSTCSTES